MPYQAIALKLRASCLAIVSGYLALRPLVAAELNPSLAAGLDLLGIGAAFAVVALAKPKHLQFLRSAKYPLILWLAALATAFAQHGAAVHSLSNFLALAGGPVIFCAAATPWGVWRQRTLAGIGFTAVLISAFAIWQGLVILPALTAQSSGSTAGFNLQLHEVAARGRVLGTFSLPILLAAYLSVVVPYLLHSVSQWGCARKRLSVWVWMALCLIAIALLSTRSIGSWLSFFVASGTIWFKRHRNPKAFALLLLALGLCGSLIIASRGVLGNRANAHDPVRNRLVYWNATLKLIQEHPIAGIGPGGFSSGYQRVTTRPDLSVRHAHNTYLQIWAEYGLLGLIAWLWLLGTILLRPLRRAPWLLVALWVLPLSSFADFSFYVPQACMLWWYLAGLSLRKNGVRPHS